LVNVQVDIPHSGPVDGYFEPMTSPAATSPAFPMQLELTSPNKVARWRPLVHWLLAIPHIIVLYGLNIAAEVVYFISWFAILFTGKMPEGLFNFLSMHMRYQWRVSSYMLFMREEYPPFDFTTTAQDPGGDPATLSFQPAAKQSRLLIFVRFLLVIPQLIVLLFIGIGIYVVVIIGFFAVIITGKWPDSLRAFVIGVMRWAYRVSIYTYLMTDEYPPFSLD
jgi:hypothetical protein